MLAKCVLASPAVGHRLYWHKTLKLVKSRLQHWADGDLSSLWSEALEDGKSLARRQSHSSSTSTSNFRRAKLAAQDGQYSKAIKAIIYPAANIPYLLQEMTTLGTLLRYSTGLTKEMSLPFVSLSGECHNCDAKKPRSFWMNCWIMQ